jgi:hypothetical protein
LWDCRQGIFLGNGGMFWGIGFGGNRMTGSSAYLAHSMVGVMYMLCNISIYIISFSFRKKIRGYRGKEKTLFF